jgi:hypothetical protein
LSLRLSSNDATVVQFSPPPSEPEKGEFSTQRDGLDGCLEGIGIDLAAAIIDGSREAFPA